MGRRKLTNPLALAVLALLYERPMHPYEMATTLRARHKEESIKLNYGSLYTVIRLLLREGYIVPQATGRIGWRPERTVYALTETGRVALHEWLSALIRTPVKEYPQFEAALSLLPVLPPEAVLPLLEERLARLDAEIARQRAAHERALAQGVERLLLIEGEYHLALLAAERQWVAGFLAELRAGQFPFLTQWRAWHATRAVPSPPTPIAPAREEE